MLGRPYELTVDLTALEDEADMFDLLGRDVLVTLERNHHRRDFAGVVARVALGDNGLLRQTGVVTVQPALSALSLGRNTRIFQDKSATQILEEVLREGLEPYGRACECGGLDPSRYATRDFCVQYRESDLDFIHRLMEEEGIGYTFEHDEVERLRLFDRNAALAPVETADRGPVSFDGTLRNVDGPEPVIQFGQRARLAATRLTVRDHDWTRSRPTIEEGSAVEDVRHLERAHEVYEHGFERHVTITEDDALLTTLMVAAQVAALPFGIPDGDLNWRATRLAGPILGSFTSNDAQAQARIRREELRFDAATAVGVSLVTAFSAGRHFELISHPTLGADGEYLLTRVVHSSVGPPTDERDGPAGAARTLNYHNRFECIPRHVPWRPARQTRKPRVHSVQTARVTGPVGLDIHTDQHGRIKVRFNWDRAPDSFAGDHTCWLRVSQSWAGNTAPGFLFIPRVGMEVVVAFVDGDPDRPLVTGCVYNGENPTPGMLPIEATKSMIRTRTVPHGMGYNELSFEDAMGRERVHLRAERDLDELVLRDRTAVVRGDRTEEVLGNRVDFTGDNRHSTVVGDRDETTHGSATTHTSGGERRVVVGPAMLQVGRSQTITVERGSRTVTVREGEHVLMSKGRTVLSQGGENHFVLHTNDEADDPKGARLETPNTITLKAGEATLTMNADGAGGIEIESPTVINLTVGGSKLVISPASIKANTKTMPAGG